MKSIRFRYRLSTLLIFMTAGCFVCFWITWPRRTAAQFAKEYFKTARFTSNPFNPGTPEAAAFRPRSIEDQPIVLVPHRRTFWDFVFAQQVFDCQMTEFTVVRGTVVGEPRSFFESSVRFYR